MGGGFNVDNFNMEQLAYMYVNSLAFMDIFHVVNNNGNTTMVHNPISQARKQELQDVYNLYKNQNNPIVKSYANSMFGSLSAYITMYPFYVNKDMAHLQTLEDLIQENHQIIQGQTYTHEFKQNVINMPSNDFVDNITRWIRELDGIIVR